MFYCLPTLSFADVGRKIHLKDDDAIKRWLIANGISIYKRSKTRFVYEIDVDVEIDKIRVKDLRNKHPNNWQELYKKIAKDDSVYEMVVYSLGGELVAKPTTKLKLTSDSDKELFKKLIA